jgi:hypothetical protein
MYLNRKDLEKIQDVLAKFPEVINFELLQENSSGIGSITTIKFMKEVNGYYGTFDIEISGQEEW